MCIRDSYGITVNGCFILGLDADTPEIFDDVLQFVRDSGLYEVQITFLTAFPGTPLYRRLKAEGRIIRDRAWELCTLFDINFRPKHCLLYTSDAADERSSVDLGGRRIIKKKKKK